MRHRFTHGYCTTLGYAYHDECMDPSELHPKHTEDRRVYEDTFPEALCESCGHPVDQPKPEDPVCIASPGK